MDKENAEYIREEVDDLLGFSMEGFNFEQIIDYSTKLTDEEKAWAKKNLSWRVYILDN